MSINNYAEPRHAHSFVCVIHVAQSQNISHLALHRKCLWAPISGEGFVCVRVSCVALALRSLCEDGFRFLHVRSAVVQ